MAIQKKITRKTDIRPIIQQAEMFYLAGDEDDFWQTLETEILRHRVKFPLLEFVAREMFRFVPLAEQLAIVDRLLPLAASHELYVKKGVGWAFKTIAKFHPELVRPWLDEILADTAVNPWCKNKLKIGLSMAEKRQGARGKRS